jgi:hypothetical protein
MITTNTNSIRLWGIDGDYNNIKTITFNDFSIFGKFVLLSNSLIVCKQVKQLFGSGGILIFDNNNDNPIHYIKQSYVFDLITISNVKIANASDAINIFDIKADYKCTMSIPRKAHSLLFIDNKNYIIAGSYKSISIWHISSNSYHMVNTIWKAHNSDINYLILLTNDYFASGSRLQNKILEC